MPSESDGMSPTRVFGPLAIVQSSVLKQLLGLFFVFVGSSVAAFGAELLLDADPELRSSVFHLALGAFAVLNGLYLGGVRFRRRN